MADDPPKPLKRPVASQKQFRAWLRELEAKILTPPWRIVPLFYYLRKGELPSPDGDVTCYACSVSYPQYHKVEVRVCPDHPNWAEERDIVNCLRHEVFHSFFGELNDLLTALAPELLTNPNTRMLLDNAEDASVNRLAAMPIFTTPTVGTHE